MIDDEVWVNLPTDIAIVVMLHHANPLAMLQILLLAKVKLSADIKVQFMVNAYDVIIAFCRFVDSSMYDELKMLIERHHHLRLRRSFVLSLAVSKGHEGIVRLILELPNQHTNDVKFHSGLALQTAAFHGRTSIARLLLEWKVHTPMAINIEALYCAVDKGHEDIVSLLLGWPKYAPKANYAMLECAARKGFNGIVRLLIYWWPKRVLPWFVFTARNTYKDPMMDIGPACATAAKEGHNDIIRLLFEHIRDDTFAQYNIIGCALASAVIAQQKGTIRLLIDMRKKLDGVLYDETLHGRLM
jgi:hypothetical protein